MSTVARSTHSRLLRGLLVGALTVAVAAGLWLCEIHRPRSRSGGIALIIVPPGASVHDVGVRLRSAGLVSHLTLFETLVLLRGDHAHLRAGEYEIPARLSLSQILDKMVRGEVVRHFVTFPEGIDIETMAQLASAQGIAPAAFIEAAQQTALVHDLDTGARDLEGYLFPDTYDVARGADAAEKLVARMVKRFRAVSAAQLPQLPLHQLSVHEWVTLASLVELETARPEERSHIAAVFLNRLKKRIPLQTDPTVIYALRKAHRYDGNIRKQDLEIDSPYNTYRYAGLPPGPIASPGRASLDAVLNPTPVADLYFVSRNDGTHVFSATLVEHQRAVNLYQRHRGSLDASIAPSSSPGTVSR